MTIAPHWQAFIDALVARGRCASADAAVEEGLRLLEEREGKLAWLRAKIDASIAEGGAQTDEEVGLEMEAFFADLERKAAKVA